MSDRPERLTPSASQTVGPFFHFALGPDATQGCLVSPDTEGERIRLRIRVLDGDGAAVPDALIEIYQADAAGAYARPGHPSRFSGFGRLPTGSDGACEFQTIRPGAVDDGRAGRQAPHVNVCILARGLLRHLFTRIYFDGDPALDSDPLLALVPAERRRTLTARAAGADAAVWEFDVRLQGQDETVFFDV
jgi:protocatechuate 3,4-dioxygenase, alpha subunit